MTKFLFAIRDDDTSYYTHPDELAAVYEEIWDTVPVSFSVVPFSVPFKQGHPHQRRSDLKKEPLMPLGENQELTGFLQNLLREQKIEIMLHGYSHEYKKIRGEWVPECIWKSEHQLKKEIPEGKEYLEKLLKASVKIFVPPSNRITKKGIQMLEQENLNLSGILGPFGDRPLTINYSRAWVRRWSWWIMHRGPYPYVLDLGRHKELVAYSLTPLTDYAKLESLLELCAEIRAPFVIATHYWEVNEYPDLKNKLHRLVEKAFKLGAKPVKVSECYG